MYLRWSGNIKEVTSELSQNGTKPGKYLKGCHIFRRTVSLKLRPSVKEDKLAGKNLIEGDKEDTWYLILALGEREGEVEMVPKNVYFQV